MAQTDPENEISKVSSPDRVAIHARGANANVQLVHPGYEEHDNGDG